MTCSPTNLSLLLQDPTADPNWSVSIRRSQLLNALESSLSILADMEDAWLAWRQASAQTEARLKHVLASSRPHYSLHDQVCPRGNADMMLPQLMHLQ